MVTRWDSEEAIFGTKRTEKKGKRKQEKTGRFLDGLSMPLQKLHFL